ncbi:MAG: ABC transporter permease [Candidatus Poseidoniales archaeon]|nr:MAG: ABC transporter permease [Candidatus Poseidoniales archaeon]
MNLLLSLALVMMIVAFLATVSAWSLWRAHSSSRMHLLALIVVPVADAVLCFFLLDWWLIDGATRLVGAISFGVISLVFIQPLLIPQRLVVWRLARETIMRRKRQAALLMLGLIIASAIITSSLVVGDSLDATVQYEVEGAWGETDITIGGFDLSTGERVTVSEDVSASIWNQSQADLQLSKTLLGQQRGLIAGVSVEGQERSLPSVTWLAFDGSIDENEVWPGIGGENGIRYAEIATSNGPERPLMVVVNAVLAEELTLTEGDSIELGWYVTDDNERRRLTANASVLKVVSNIGQGAAAGTSTPALFTDLNTAQRLQQLDGQVNTLHYAVATSHEHAAGIEPIVEALELHLDEALTAESIGLQFDVDGSTDTISVSSTSGLGRLSGMDVAALRENTTSLGIDTMMEVLQVPLIDLSLEDESLLTLADNQPNDLVLGERGLWHSSPSGFGVQIDGSGEAWVWRVPDGGALYDFALSSDGQLGGAVHAGGMVIGSEQDLDAEEWASYTSDASMRTIVGDSSGWWAIEASEEALLLHHFSRDLSTHEQRLLAVDIPSKILNVDLFIDGGFHLEIEGLLSIERYTSQTVDLNSTFIVYNGNQWPSFVPSTSTVAEHQRCDGGVSVSGFTPIQHWCSFEEGLMRWNAQDQTIESIRLPVLSSAGGFGTMPQLLLAFGGQDAPFEVQNSSMLISQRLSVLNLSEDETHFWLKGLIPYAFGDDTAYRLTNEGYYTDIDGLEGLSELDGVVLGLVSLTDAERLASAAEDERNLLVLTSLDGNSSATAITVQSWFDEQATGSDLNLNVQAVKIEAAAMAAESSGVLAAMFLVFGSFTIAAGVLLVLTIVLMLAEARRGEFGTLRSIGLSQSDARALAVMEGGLVGSVSAALGSVLGLGLAWFISIGFQQMFSSVGSGQFVFEWTLGSVFAGWAWGFLLAMLTLWCTAVWTARTNIVVALRGGREPSTGTVSWLLVLIQVLFAGAGALCLAVLAVVGLDSSFAYFTWVVSGVCFLIAFVPGLTFEVPTFLRQRSKAWANLHRHAGRNTLGVLGLSLLVWTVGLHGIDPVRQGMTPDELSFIVLGLVEVFAGVLLLTSAAPLLVGRLGKSKRLTKRFGPVLPVALAHPLAAPARTAVVMGMFSITVFSVVVLGGYAEQFDNYSSSFVEDAEGEYELLLTGSMSRPIELPDDPAEWNLTSSVASSIDSVARIERSQVFLENAEGERMPYILRGFDENFSSHGGLPLYQWDPSLGESQREAWITVGSRDDLVFVDASFGLESVADGSGLSMLSFSIGESISLIDISNPGNTRNVKVAGFMEQSSYLFSAGVWISDDVTSEQFDGRLTRMYISVEDEAQSSEGFVLGEPMPPMGKPGEARTAAAELAEDLGGTLNSKGVQVSIIAEDVMVIQSLVLSLLAIFEAYLALGLVVGIAGIGVVTVRSVSERTKTIGILRALGYRRSMVMATFSIEVVWVAVFGMINGALIAIGFHRALYETFWEAQGAAFTLPYGTIFAVLLGGLALVVCATAYPIRKASIIPPSAALRES